MFMIMKHTDIKKLMYRHWSAASRSSRSNKCSNTFYNKYVKGKDALEIEADFNAALAESDYAAFSAGVQACVDALRSLRIID